MAEKQESELSMIFEDPPWFAVQDEYGNWHSTEHMWTTDRSVNGDRVASITTRKVYYVYVDRVMLHEFGHTLGLHEFGHTLGLPDFYS